MKAETFDFLSVFVFWSFDVLLRQTSQEISPQTFACLQQININKQCIALLWGKSYKHCNVYNFCLKAYIVESNLQYWPNYRLVLMSNNLHCWEQLTMLTSRHLSECLQLKRFHPVNMWHRQCRFCHRRYHRLYIICTEVPLALRISPLQCWWLYWSLTASSEGGLQGV